MKPDPIAVEMAAYAAQQLGLEAVGDGAAGVYGGRRIELETSVFYNEDSRPVWHHDVRAVLDPPLDLGLEICPASFASVFPTEIAGDPTLDGELHITADDVARARHVFTAELRDLLLRNVHERRDVALDDRGARSSCREGVIPCVTLLLEAAQALEDARCGLPPPRALVGVVDVLARIASSHGLHLSLAPPGVLGLVEGRRVAVGSKRTGPSRHSLAARVAFADPLALGLMVRRQTLLDDVAVLFGAQDVRIGAEPFDRRFLVRARRSDAHRVVALFDADVRPMLLEFDARFGALAIDDDALSIDPLDADADTTALADFVTGLVDAAARIEARARNSGAGPYR